MSKWKDLKTYMEVNPYTGQPKTEDAPANATGVNVAGTGDDSTGNSGSPGASGESPVGSKEDNSKITKSCTRRTYVKKKSCKTRV